jgi:hypothetical protein
MDPRSVQLASRPVLRHIPVAGMLPVIHTRNTFPLQVQITAWAGPVPETADVPRRMEPDDRKGHADGDA